MTNKQQVVEPQRMPLTDGQIQDVVTKAVNGGAMSWMGFKKDLSGEYTIPLITKGDYDFARAIEKAVLETCSST